MNHQDRIGKLILDTAHQLKVSLDASFEDTGINGLQARILGLIDRNSKLHKDTYQRDIETEFKIRRSSVSSVLDTMEKNGYIVRQAVSTDARLKKLVLTEKAKKVSRQHKNAIDKFEQNAVRGFSEAEVETLKKLIEKVVENIENFRGDKND